MYGRDRCGRVLTLRSIEVQQHLGTRMGKTRAKLSVLLEQQLRGRLTRSWPPTQVAPAGRAPMAETAVGRRAPSLRTDRARSRAYRLAPTLQEPWSGAPNAVAGEAPLVPVTERWRSGRAGPPCTLHR